jgi:prepilin-type N-terminal cleavage/methylation domain-containing protein
MFFTNGRKAFTLMEMMVSVLVLGVLASLALPKYTTAVEKVRSAEGFEILEALLKAQKSFFFENQTYAGPPLTNLDITIPPVANFAAPTIANPGPLGGIVAQIVRNGPSYTLRITDTGAISCTGGAAGLCARIGCPGGPPGACN